MKFISTILSCARGERATRLNEIQSPEQFRTVIDRERSRADRCRTGFSLVFFTCAAGDYIKTRKNMRRLLSAIHRRIRCTDYAGWTGEQELGMLMLDCSIEQVNELAATLSTEFAPTLGPLSYRIETYPDAPSTKIISASADSDERSPASSEAMPA